MHDHHHCLHLTLAHCAHCDVAYCKGCKREWGGHRHWLYSTPPWFYQPVWGSGSTGGEITINAMNAPALACEGHS